MMLHQKPLPKTRWKKIVVGTAKITLGIWIASHFAVSESHAQSGDTKASSGRDKVQFDESLMNSSPFDLLTVKDGDSTRAVKVFPVDFPGRKKPTSPDPESKLNVVMLKYPDRKYEVQWKNIISIDLFEIMVRRDAEKLLAEKDFAAAFEHLNYLIENHPQTEGLAKLHEDFLFACAINFNEQQNLPHTLAVLEEFERSFPKSRKSLPNAISKVAGQLIQRYVDSGDLRAAQMLIARLREDYKENPLDVVIQWDAEFARRANVLREQAEEFLAKGNGREARRISSQMIAIDPNLPGGKELVARAIAAYPMIRVGVFEKSDRPDPTSLTDWAARRSGALTSNSLFEFKSTGTEGGEYRFLLGSFQQSDDRRELELMINPKNSPIASSELAQWMLERANPDSTQYMPSWAALVQEIAVDGVNRLTVRLRQPHVLPHAMLQWDMSMLTNRNPGDRIGSYVIKEGEGGSTSFLWSDSSPPTEGRPVEFYEKLYEKSEDAVSDLLRGEVDVIDQLYPADAARLDGMRGITVGRYELPMIHMLVPISSHAYLREVEFRRALLYGSNRQSILTSELLGGIASEGCSLVSGPFPIGKSESDPLSYAYNSSILPIGFDPGLCKLLLRLTSDKIGKMASNKKEPKPELKTVRLAVPNVEWARIAGESLIQQWKLLEIPAELVVLPTGKSVCTAEEADLLYVSVSIWEPATDTERVFGEGGIAASDNPYIVQALGTLRASKNWIDVRRSLQDIHQLVSNHLPVLPLWQMSNSFAYRSYVKGIAKKPLTLYQDLDKWRIEEASSVAP